MARAHGRLAEGTILVFRAGNAASGSSGGGHSTVRAYSQVILTWAEIVHRTDSARSVSNCRPDLAIVSGYTIAISLQRGLDCRAQIRRTAVGGGLGTPIVLQTLLTPDHLIPEQQAWTLDSDAAICLD